MRLPWVSRARLDAAVERARWAENSAETSWQLVATAQRMYADILEKYHALRLQGANPAEPKPEPRPAPEPDIVTQAILAKAGKSALLRKHYHEYVTEQRGLGVDDEAIAAAIRVGVEDNEGLPG